MALMMSCAIVASLTMLWILNIIECTTFGVLEVLPPDHFLAVPGGNITFTCLNTQENVEIQEIDWRFNGSPLENLETPKVQATFLHFANGIGRLRINDVPIDFNGTTVQCVGTLTTGYSVVSNTASILIQQDHLPAVESLTLSVENSIISLTWVAPFSNTPLTYIVNVRSSTTESLFETRSGINDTSFTYPLPERSYCDIYLFEVYPVNKNGMTGAETIISYNGTQISPMVIASGLRMDNTYFLTMSAPVCGAELTFSDIDTGEIITLGDTDLTISETNITFTTQQLRQNRHYNVIATAYNVQSPIVYAFTLSTHGVESASILYIEQDTRISVSYPRYSSESGALISLISDGDSPDVVNFNRSVTLALDRNTSLDYVLPFQLFSGRYRMFVFDIDEGGTLHIGVCYPAVVGDILIGADSQGFPAQEQSSPCTIHNVLNQITSFCTFDDPVVTGYQLIAQHDSSSEVQIVYATKTTNLLIPASIEVGVNGLYQVTIFPIRGELGITNSNMKFVVQLEVNDPSTESEITISTTTNPTNAQPKTAYNSIIVLAMVTFSAL